MSKDRPDNNIIKAVLFILFFVAILTVSSILVKPEFGEVYNIVQVRQKMDSFKKEKPNTIDIIFAGNSEVYRTFSPLQIFYDKGFTSYCMSESALRLCDALELTKAAFETQDPKVVVLEADAIFSDSDPHKDNYALPTNFIEDIFPIFHYHIFYKAYVPKFIYEGDVALRTEHALRGFVETDMSVPYMGPADYMNEGDHVRINRDSRKYLDMFREFCEEKNVPLLLTAAPNAQNWNNYKHKSLQEYADKYGLDFIDLNLHIDDMGLDWNEDTMDGGNHVSFSGSKKTTGFIEEYLDQNYDLTDHRDDPQYDDWKKDNEEYELYP